MSADLTGVSVLVAGAGLAGLCAARDLARWGADVTVDRGARPRRRAGAHRSRRLRRLAARRGRRRHDRRGSARDSRSSPTSSACRWSRILKNGFGYVRPRPGRQASRIVSRSVARGWERLAEALSELCAAVPARRAALGHADRQRARAADRSRSGSTTSQADDELRATATGLRGFFLADPEELSLLGARRSVRQRRRRAARGEMYRIEGRQRSAGDATGRRPGRSCAARHRARRRVAARPRRARERQERAARSSQMSVRLPGVRAAGDAAAPHSDHAGAAGAAARSDRAAALRARHQDAAAVRAAVLARAGAAAGVRLAAALRRRLGRQRRTARPSRASSSLLAGGSASDATADIVAQRRRRAALARSLDWLGSRDRADVVGWRQFRWEADPWSRGGYAVFDRDLRSRRSAAGWRSRAAGCSSPASTPASRGRAT